MGVSSKGDKVNKRAALKIIRILLTYTSRRRHEATILKTPSNQTQILFFLLFFQKEVGGICYLHNRLKYIPNKGLMSSYQLNIRRHTEFKTKILQWVMIKELANVE